MFVPVVEVAWVVMGEEALEVVVAGVVVDVDFGLEALGVADGRLQIDFPVLAATDALTSMAVAVEVTVVRSSSAALKASAAS